MNQILELWLPIVLSSVFIFIASSIIWMVLPYHKEDIQKLPDEAGFLSALKTQNIPAGLYMWPNCLDSAKMKSDAFKQRFEAGPWGSINVIEKKPNFARNMLLTFVFYLIVSIFVAYITKEARPFGASYLSVFQVAGATAILAYCAGGIPGAIYMGTPPRFIVTSLLDAVIYGLITAGTFGWLWPAVNAAEGGGGGGLLTP